MGNNMTGDVPPRYIPFDKSGLWGRRRGHVYLYFAISILGLASLIHLDTISRFVVSPAASQASELQLLQGIEKCKASVWAKDAQDSSSVRHHNPRWNAVNGQAKSVVLQNATLFDGEVILKHAVDIVFTEGLIRSISRTEESHEIDENSVVVDLYGGFVTPGLVDMHSHHLESPFPSLRATGDVNEAPGLGPITPFVRALDGFKAYDPAILYIASGGVTSSLNLPGSSNLIGGEAYPVKNLPYPGTNREPIVDHLLLELGIHPELRRRYLKMACGENPKFKYAHSRPGLIWLLRQHLNEARQLKSRQDVWCSEASCIAAKPYAHTQRLVTFLRSAGAFPENFELESTLALLRGKFNVNIHCYEPEDLERILDVLHEFGIHPRAFHHAIEAWRVPEFLKRQEENITIATFAENALFKHEAYDSSLRAPKILNDHGIAVALKSDHGGESNFAKYLLNQASIAHSFGLPEEKALQSVTSIPAQSIQQSHRIGYARPGYDADLVVWDSHPLRVGAIPKQVFIDGRPVLESLATIEEQDLGKEAAFKKASAPQMRLVVSPKQASICSRIVRPGVELLFTGISDLFVDIPFTPHMEEARNKGELSIAIRNNRITCIDQHNICLGSFTSDNPQDIMKIHLGNGYITPGLVAVGNSLGMQDISSETSTGDGIGKSDTIHFAKYGVHLGGKGFERARIGGVTKAITAPCSRGDVSPRVSVGLRTNKNSTILNGAIWKDEVALHVNIGQEGKGEKYPSVSSGVEHLQQILETSSSGKNMLFARVANGSLPVIVHTVNQDDISQIVLLKRQFPNVHFVIFGGHGAALVARELVEAAIPVILSPARGAPASWETRETLIGPPLTKSSSSVLLEAGVKVGLAVKGDSKVHGLAQEAQWAAKFAGIEPKEAIKLVSSNLEEILLLRASWAIKEDATKNYNIGDFVIWDGNPLEGEGNVVISVYENGKIGDCRPDV